VSRSPCSDHPAGDFPGVGAQGVFLTSEPFISVIGGLLPIALDLSRFDAAPLIAFIAAKETDYGNETDGRIPC